MLSVGFRFVAVVQSSVVVVLRLSLFNQLLFNYVDQFQKRAVILSLDTFLTTSGLR